MVVMYLASRQATVNFTIIIIKSFRDPQSLTEKKKIEKFTSQQKMYYKIAPYSLFFHCVSPPFSFLLPPPTYPSWLGWTTLYTSLLLYKTAIKTSNFPKRAPYIH